MSMETQHKTPLARFLDGEIEDVFDHGTPAPDHTVFRRLRNGKSIQERCELWLSANPHILPLFIEYALEAKRRGYEHYGIQSIAERVRWHLDIETEDAYESWKVNNTYLAPLSRRIEEEEPRLKDFFTKRVRRAE